VTAADPSFEPDLFRGREPSDFSAARARWLVRLRFVATACILLCSLFALTDLFDGVAYPVLVGAGLVGLAYNLVLFAREKRGSQKAPSPLPQAFVDIVLLTVVLWAAGGIDSPFLAFYVFHVALVAILAGKRAALAAIGVCALGAAFLGAATMIPELAIGTWHPRHPWDGIAEATAFSITVVGVAYLVSHATRDLRDREKALEVARHRASLEYQLLTNTLQELDAGLEVVDEKGSVIWRNRRAIELGPGESPWKCPREQKKACERDVSGRCPFDSASEVGEPGRCRFAAQVDGAERVYELLSFPLPDGDNRGRVMNLYVDRTLATLDERRLVTTERLVSLGRVAQGVAHELNTPLATIRTLATDMRAAIRDLSHDTRLASVGADLDESAALIHDETRRLGRITQALLAGGDLVRTRVDGSVPLQAALERARALVFAGVRSGPRIVIDGRIDTLAVSADPDRLVQVLVNLLQNALDAVRDVRDPVVTIDAKVDDSRVSLRIEDNGPGLRPEIERRLFEPFSTSKPLGQGTGLGLYTSYMLAQAMGGMLTVENRDEGGVRATIRLPLADSLATLPLSGQRAPSSLS
jgi:signal transduction histidine kinase